MGREALSEDVLRETVEAWESAGRSIEGGARALGMNYGTFHSRLKRAKRKGYHLSEGAMTAIQNARLNPVEGKGGWIHNYEVGDDGKRYKIGTTRWSAGEIGEEERQNLIDQIKAALADVPVAPPIIQSETGKAGMVALFPHQDVHMGADVSEDYAGRKYNPQEAYRRMTDGFSEIHLTIPPCETAIILNNGDLTHANDNRDVTYKSQHRLKVAGSHRDNLALCLTATVWQIELALSKHDRVIYRANAGNHDPNTPDILTLSLEQRYRNNPRVQIENSQRKTWVFQKDRLFIAAHHGDDIKPQKVAGSLPTTFPREFGASDNWFFFTGHLHHEVKILVNGIVCWQLPSVCALDQHASDLLYNDTAALRSFLFCTRNGLKSDHTVRL